MFYHLNLGLKKWGVQFTRIDVGSNVQRVRAESLLPGFNDSAKMEPTLLLREGWGFWLSPLFRHTPELQKCFQAHFEVGEAVESSDCVTRRDRVMRSTSMSRLSDWFATPSSQVRFLDSLRISSHRLVRCWIQFIGGRFGELTFFSQTWVIEPMPTLIVVEPHSYCIFQN